MQWHDIGAKQWTRQHYGVGDGDGDGDGDDAGDGDGYGDTYTIHTTYTRAV